MNIKAIALSFREPGRRKYWLIPLAVLVLAVPVIRRKLAISREKPPEGYPVVLQLVKPREGVLRSQETFLGLFRPVDQAALSSRLSARVVYIAEEGTPVKKGDVVLRLDTSDLSAGAEALDIKRQNQLKVYDRDKILFSSGAISQEQLENSQNLYEQANASYQAAAAQLSYGVMTAPFDAVVGKRYLSPGDTAVPGKPLLQLDGSGPDHEVYSDLPVRTAVKIKPGSEQLIHFNGASQFARVKAVVPAAANNLMTVKLAVKGDRLGIPAGTYVDTVFYTSVSRGLIAPAGAVLRGMDGDKALTVADGKARWVPVKVLGTDGVNYCLEGLPAGAQLGAAAPQDLLKIYDGQPVRAAGEAAPND